MYKTIGNFIGYIFRFFFILFQSTPINSTVFSGLRALDPDSNVNGQVEFRVLQDYQDVQGLFSIDLPHQGIVRTAGKLDYEQARRHFVTIVASVR